MNEPAGFPEMEPKLQVKQEASEFQDAYYD
jgi:hypothetical protein